MATVYVDPDYTESMVPVHVTDHTLARALHAALRGDDDQFRAFLTLFSMLDVPEVTT